MVYGIANQQRKGFVVMRTTSAVLCMILTIAAASGTEQGRLRIENNMIVTDMGSLLRGGPIQIDQHATAHSVRLAVWEQYRDAKCNHLRITYDGNGDGALRPALTLEQIKPMFDIAVEWGIGVTH